MPCAKKMMWTSAGRDVWEMKGRIVAGYTERVMDEAIAWHLCLEEAGAEEWNDFVAWLEADPGHRSAYDRLALEDAELAEAIERTPPPARTCAATVTSRIVTTPHRAWLRRSGWGGGLLAAAAAAWLALLPAALPASDTYSISTRPGMRHMVVLADGTHVEMNGGTTLTLDRAHPRLAVLERGEAMFDVVHHADRPFEVRINGVTLRDVGTRFNVARGEGTLRVAVAEGSVLFQPEREAVSLTRGMALAIKDGEDRLELRRTDADAVGGWRQGRLDFRNTPLASVAEDVSRSTGTRLNVPAEMAARPFTGTLRVDRPAETVVRNLAMIVGGEARRDGPGWLIAPRSAGAP